VTPWVALAALAVAYALTLWRLRAARALLRKAQRELAAVQRVEPVTPSRYAAPGSVSALAAAITYVSQRDLPVGTAVQRVEPVTPSPRRGR
jgi:hypothetical protein